WAVMAFISAWSFLLSIELFSTLQAKFASMSDAPTIVRGVIFPLLFAQSKLLMLVVAIVAGLSFARLSQNQSWSLLVNTQLPDWQIVLQKYAALLLVCIVFMLPNFLTILSLVVMAQLPLLAISIALMGLLLMLIWILALGMWLSSLVDNSGFAILLCFSVFMLLWLISQSSLDAQWGKNWLQVFSPFFQFSRFTSDTVPLAAVYYFVLGTVISLWAVTVRLLHKRHQL
ncbi:MAG: hypothetical protein L3J83_11365, partial [Proteobacteria bacterium]|nr:hypothetical protein [Pseudomonadota bacterium]